MRSADISRLRLKDHILSAADVVIKVDLGDVYWMDFTIFDEVVNRGRKAAEDALPKIREVLARKTTKVAPKKDSSFLKLHVREE